MNKKLKVEAHKNAIENINLKANQLLGMVEPIEFIPRDDNEFKSDRPISGTITRDKVHGDLVFRNETIGGDFGICFLTLEEQPYGIKGGALDKLDDLVSVLSKIDVVNKTAGDDCIENIIFDWLRVRKQQSSRKWFWTFFRDALQSKVKSFEVYVAIDGIETEVSAQFGGVGILPLEKNDFDRWEETCKEFSPNQTEDIKALFDKMRQDMQGFAAVRINLVAEPNFAHKAAFEVAGRVCDGLRIFSPQRESLANRALYAPFGTAVHPQSHTISISEDDSFSYSNSSLDKGGHLWRLRRDKFQLMLDDNFNIVFKIAVDGPNNDFEEHVWKSICAFSKSFTPVDIHDRLAFRVSALESMLLKNNSEPIGTMVGERMAFLLSNEPKSRQEIVKNFKNIYKMRSDYVHHRKTRNELQEMEYFALLAWRTMQTLLQNIGQFSKKQYFFEALEEMRYGGSNG